jgi:hypothetical protein
MTAINVTYNFIQHSVLMPNFTIDIGETTRDYQRAFLRNRAIASQIS